MSLNIRVALLKSIVALFILFFSLPTMAQRMDTDNLNQLKAGKEKSLNRRDMRRHQKLVYKENMSRQTPSARKMMRKDAKKSKRLNDGKNPNSFFDKIVKRFKKRKTSKSSRR